MSTMHLRKMIMPFRIFAVLVAVVLMTGDCFSQSESESDDKAVAVKEDSSDPADPPQKVIADDTRHLVNFETDIKPIFTAKCAECHCDEYQEGDLNFDDLDTLKDFIVPNDHIGSELYRVMVTDDEDELMPPPYDVEEEGKMTTQEIAMIALWIDEGAHYDVPPPPPAPETEQLAMRIWRFLGTFHPVLTHFPVALFMVGAFFVIFFRRNIALANEASFYCLALGTFGAIVACAFGWSLAFESLAFDKNDNIYDPEGRMFWHRWSGISIAAIAFIVWIVAWRQRSEDYADGGGSWKLGLILLAGVVSFVGYQGGELVYGENHYMNQLKRYLPEAHEQVESIISPGNQKGDGEQDADAEKAKASEEKSDNASSADKDKASSADKDKAAGEGGADDNTKSSDDDIDA